MNYSKWISHFERNRQDRTEPEWTAPITIRPEILAALLPSLEQFRLGDGGGPASLIAHDAERFRSRTTEMRFLVDRWFAEEAEHARLLGCAVDRFGGRPHHVALELHGILPLPARAGRAVRVAGAAAHRTRQHRLLPLAPPSFARRAARRYVRAHSARRGGPRRVPPRAIGRCRPLTTRSRRGAVAGAVLALRSRCGDRALDQSRPVPGSHRRF